MKKLILSIFIITPTLLFSQLIRRSVADGIATNPFVWDCICIPLPNDSVVINHNITLNTDFGYTDGGVFINSSGRLIGDSPMRAFAMTGGSFTNNGIFDVARVAFIGGTAISTNQFAADSLLTNITLGNFTVSGSMNITTSYWNTGSFSLSSGSQLLVGDNFYNGDSLISGVNAKFINNGGVRISQDFANSDTIKGSGQICIEGSSLNIGVITGTLDVCDISGSMIVDIQLGTIGASVQTCNSPCTISVEEENSSSMSIFPNPANSFVQIETKLPSKVNIYNSLGQLVQNITTEQLVHPISIEHFSKGIFLVEVISGNTRDLSKLIIQ